ncbi:MULTISPECIES: hypothetical protein [Jonquetella]|uniref:hypothetical protein n=1 Tax=Jonquetella TaxID=428711 RepID=UPI0003ADDDCC|nr:MULTISPECIES: hypothetical protein [Jonquetella]ERL24445.1 hypothetical protein HMPREF1249_1514 [Jonquetella sp. BV3C21]
MKKSILAALSLLLVSSAGWAFTNEPDGFGNITWGGSKDSRPDLSVQQDARYGSRPVLTSKWYTSPTETFVLGGVTMDTPVYGFDPDLGFWDVTASSRERLSEDQKAELKKWLIQTYGEPDYSGTFKPVFGPQSPALSWRGDKTLLRVVFSATVTVEYSSAQLANKAVLLDAKRRTK